MENTINAVSHVMQMERSRVDTSTPASKQQDVLVKHADRVKEKPEPNAQAVRRAAERLNEAIEMFNRDLNISVHKCGKLVVRVTDPKTGEVLREIPPERILEVEENLDQIVGLFVNDMA